LGKALFNILLIFGTLSQPTRCFAGASDGYSVRGKLDSKWFKVDGSFDDQQIWVFEIEVYGSTWSVKSTCVEWAHQVLESFFDGTNVFRITNNRLFGSEVPTEVQVSHFGFPAQNYAENIPWLAFASSIFLRPDSKFVLPSPWASSRHLEALVTEAKVTLSETVPRLPSVLSFQVSHAGLTNALLDHPFAAYEAEFPGAEARVRDFVKLYEDGFEVGSYQVTEWQVLNDLTLPKRFELQVFAKAMVGGALEVCSIATFFGETEEVRVKTEPIERPEPRLPITVIDYRFRDAAARVDNIMYSMSTFEVPNVADENLQQLFAVKKERFLEKQTVGTVGIFGYALRLGIVMLIVAPAGIWFLRRPAD
jgi:hypothetical protein